MIGNHSRRRRGTTGEGCPTPGRQERRDRRMATWRTLGVASALLLGAACAPNPAWEATKAANQLLEEGHNEEALAAYRQGQTEFPEFALLHHGEGLALYQLGKFSEAEAPLRRALELDPDESEPYLHLGHVLARLERWEEAIEAYETLTGDDPMNAPGWKGLGFTQYSRGYYVEARVALEKYLAFAPAAEDRFGVSELIRSLPEADNADSGSS